MQQPDIESALHYCTGVHILTAPSPKHSTHFKMISLQSNFTNLCFYSLEWQSSELYFSLTHQDLFTELFFSFLVSKLWYYHSISFIVTILSWLALPENFWGQKDWRGRFFNGYLSFFPLYLYNHKVIYCLMASFFTLLCSTHHLYRHPCGFSTSQHTAHVVTRQLFSCWLTCCLQPPRV